ncbi:MAG: tRNA epoxyqueuosine(34) reductase QueG [Anaerolineales bacterium]
MKNTGLSERIKQKAHELGFTLAGITTAQPPAHQEVYRRWLQAGRHGEMGYLATPSAIERRGDPRSILPECKSILVLGIPYSNPASAKKPGDGRAYGRMAAYAWGEDYHEVLKERLQGIVAFIEETVGHRVPNRWYTDSGPLLERELAQRAGLGWIGKNSMLINPERGSYFLLAEILLGLELPVDAPMASDHCGSCTRCIKACPTQCILDDRTLDATRCISYLTIELKGSIDEELRPLMQDWVYGCDICQVVCPWNGRFAQAEGDAAFAAREATAWIDLDTEMRIDVQRFNQKFKKTPVQRARRRGYLRNLTVAAGNHGLAPSVPALAGALLEESEPLARGHAAWALGRIGGRDAQAALDEAARAEKDERVRGEIRAAREAS